MEIFLEDPRPQLLKEIPTEDGGSAVLSENGLPLRVPLKMGVPPKWEVPLKNDEKIKVRRMEFSIVEILSGLQESIFSLFRRAQKSPN